MPRHVTNTVTFFMKSGAPPWRPLAMIRFLKMVPQLSNMSLLILIECTQFLFSENRNQV